MKSQTSKRHVGRFLRLPLWVMWCGRDWHGRAGRHSHITGLVRSGASISETKELARHADIRQIVKYTHIGMEDRGKRWHFYNKLVY